MNIPIFEASLFRKCRDGDNKACRELVEGFWDRRIIWKYGLPTIQIPDPEAPLPGPRPYPPEPYAQLQERVWIHEQLLSDLIGHLAGDPSPQPSIVTNLLDPEIRLKSVQKMHQKLTDSLKAMEEELNALKKQV